MQLVARRSTIQSIAAVVGAWLVGVTVVAVHHLWVWPQTLGPIEVAWKILEPDTARIAQSATSWLVLSAAVTAYEVARLRARERWSADRPYSTWRTVKSVLLAAGWTGVLAYILSLSVSLALFRAAPEIPSPAPALATIVASFGPISLAGGVVMVAIDARRNVNRDHG